MSRRVLCWCCLLLAWGGVPGGGWAGASEGDLSRRAGWHTLETANFRLVNYGFAPVSPETAELCERLRAELARQWFQDPAIEAWAPKCHVVLHPSSASYLREVGTEGRATVASALVDRKAGRVALRRIDICAARPDWQTTALAHELVHVVLADRFADRALPRWLDEGMAILADPEDKRERHLRAARHAVAHGVQFRLAELFLLADYPPAGRWGAFYGQSASLVEYLVDEQGPARFAEFVELALEQGYETALRRVYQLGLGELERRWHARLAAGGVRGVGRLVSNAP